MNISIEIFMSFFKSIELFFLKLPLQHPFQTSFGVQYDNESILTKLTTSNGQVGWGEIPLTFDPGYCYETVSTARHILADFIIPGLKSANTNPEFRESSINDWTSLYQTIVKDIRGHEFTKAGLEFSLWNLRSEIEGKHLSKLLGATKEKIPVGISIGIQENKDKIVKDIQNALENKYKRIKIKIGPENDIEIIKHIRKELGDFPLMVDANSAYTLEDVDHLKKLDKFDLLMIEQPLAYNDIVDHAILQKNMETPVCLDESIHSVDDVRKAFSDNIFLYFDCFLYTCL